MNFIIEDEKIFEKKKSQGVKLDLHTWVKKVLQGHLHNGVKIFKFKLKPNIPSLPSFSYYFLKF